MKADAYSEPSQTSKMELFANIVNGLQLLLKIFAERSIFDIYGFCEYAPERTLVIIVSHLEAFIAVFMTCKRPSKPSWSIVICMKATKTQLSFCRNLLEPCDFGNCCLTIKNNANIWPIDELLTILNLLYWMEGTLMKLGRWWSDVFH